MKPTLINGKKPLPKHKVYAIYIKHKALAFYHSKWYTLLKWSVQLITLSLLLYWLFSPVKSSERVYQSAIVAQPVAMKQTREKCTTCKDFPMDDVYISLAQNIEKTHGVPTAITLAQLALETSYGKSKLMKVHNYFGHKYYDNNSLEGLQGSMPAKDDCGSEDCLFRGYETRWYGFYHHGRILKERYAPFLRENKDMTKAWAECLCAKEHKIGTRNYATACKNKKYTNTLLKIISIYDLKQHNLEWATLD